MRDRIGTFDLNDEEQVKAWKDEAHRRWRAASLVSWTDIVIDLLRSDWKPEDWRLVKARELAAAAVSKLHDMESTVKMVREGSSDRHTSVQSALAAIRWCESQGFKKP